MRENGIAAKDCKERKKHTVVATVPKVRDVPNQIMSQAAAMCRDLTRSRHPERGDGLKPAIGVIQGARARNAKRQTSPAGAGNLAQPVAH
jgi:hypothetical protein